MGHDCAPGIGADGNTQLDEVLALWIERPGGPAGLTQLLVILKYLRKLAGKFFVNFLSR
jgi:hypothetical protein